MSLDQLNKLDKIIKALRDPETGCPWDLEQTHSSLLPYLLEEAYEYIDAVQEDNFKSMEEELGDVLLQVFLHAQVAQDEGKFDLESVAKKLAEKLIERHPHVFSESKEAPQLSSKQVEKNWNKIKAKEKKTKELMPASLLKFPGLISAYKIGKKTEQISFDWDDPQQVAYKVEEEWQELKEELMQPKEQKKNQRIQEEMGDLLFSLVQLCRHLELDPELSLREANKKFLSRFSAMEKLIAESSHDITQMNQSEMDVYWDQAKRLENGHETKA